MNILRNILVTIAETYEKRNILIFIDILWYGWAKQVM